MRGARGGGAIIVGQFARLGLQLAGFVVLSRLLEPGDFGVVALVGVFLAAGELLRDFGLPTAALQAKTLSHQQASNMFWAAAILGGVAGLVVAGLTPVLVAIYDEDRLAVLVPVMATTLVINGLQAQTQVQMARAGRFTQIVATDLTALLVALGLAISAAFAGWGYWALVTQLVTNAVILLILRTIASRWRPLRPRRGHGSARLLRNGSEFGLAQLLAFAASNVDTLLIGRRWGLGDLGQYNRGFQLYMLPRSGVLDPLTRVVVPTLNAAVSQGRRATEVLLQIQFILGALLAWIYLVLAVGAEWVIPLGLGGQWTGSIRVFQALAAGGMFAAFGTVSYWAFIVEDRSRDLLGLHLITKPISVLLVVAAVPHGIVAVALAYSVGLAVAWPINLWWLARCTGQDSWAYVRVGLRVLSATFVAACVGRGIVALTGGTGVAVSAAIGIVGASVVYIGTLGLYTNGRAEIRACLRLVRASRSSQHNSKGPFVKSSEM